MNFPPDWLYRILSRLVERWSSVRRISSTSIVPATSDSSAAHLLAEIKAREWWQGTVVEPEFYPTELNASEFDRWILISQACNIYNSSFDRVPAVEFIGAKLIDTCDPGKTKGDNPRILHTVACGAEGQIALEVHIHVRRWLPRVTLSQGKHCDLKVMDMPNSDAWLDTLSGWLGRSYTRVALPDEFNTALDKSKIQDVLQKKLTRRSSELYGIYFSLSSVEDLQDGQSPVLGMLPPPYVLGIILVANEDTDTFQLRTQLVRSLFVDKINDPDNSGRQLTRAELARRYSVEIIEEGVEVLSVAEFTVKELKSVVRYSMVDHLSNAGMAAP